MNSIEEIERILKIAPGDYYIAPSLDIVDLVRKDLATGIDVQDYFNKYIEMLAYMHSKYIFEYLDELRDSLQICGDMSKTELRSPDLLKPTFGYETYLGDDLLSYEFRGALIDMIAQVSEDLLIGTDVASIDWKTVEAKSDYDTEEEKKMMEADLINGKNAVAEEGH